MKKILLSLLLLFNALTAAHAQLSVKNNAPYNVWVAVGYYVPGTGEWYSEGWYKLNHGDVVKVFDYDLSYNRYYYYYAYDDDGNYWLGDKSCTDCQDFWVNTKEKFKISRSSQTLGANVEAKRFRLIDANGGPAYTLTLTDTDWSTGDCQNGFGTYKWVTQSKKYTGYWKNGLRNGQGTGEYGKYHSKFSGCKYEGLWENNFWKKGTLTWSTGDAYTGDFANEKRNGKGEMRYADGNVYNGEWKDDLKYGFGKMTWTKGFKTYEGNWVDDKRNGQGTSSYTAQHGKYPNCKFTGTWKDDLWVEGTFTYADKSKYVGAFNRDQKREGKGVLYDASGKVLKSGTWVNDELIQADATQPVIVWDAPFNANTTVYSASVNIKVCVQSKTPVTDAKIYVNGSLFVPRGAQVEDNCAKSINTAIALNKGKNTVYVVASNEAGSTQSENRVIYYQSQEPEPVEASNNYALIIGESDYEAIGIEDLANPVQDAEQLKNVLQQRYGFPPENIRFLKNAKKQLIVDEFTRLQQKLMPDDNLLVFYAGHGKMQGEQGYWLAADAQLESAYNWISTAELDGYIKGLKTKHFLLISDACYSGAFVMRDVDDIPNGTQEEACEILAAKKSRCAMTSGAKTTVPDQSVFMKYLVKELRENPQSCFSAEQLYMNIKNTVIYNSPNRQIPQFGQIPLTGHEGGNFIFKKG